MKIIINKYCKYSDGTEFHATVISALAGEIWRDYYTPIIGAERVEYMLAKFQSPKQIYQDITENDFIYFTAKFISDGKNIGYSAFKPGHNHLFLSKIYVCKEYRGKGVFRKFFEEILALCHRKYGFCKIRLTVNKKMKLQSQFIKNSDLK